MSLDIDLVVPKLVAVASFNITHNLTTMADEAGLYEFLWKPETLGITKAEQLIVPLTEGLNKLKVDPDKYKKLNPDNGWGTYEGLVAFVEQYLDSCKTHPDAGINISR